MLTDQASIPLSDQTDARRNPISNQRQSAEQKGIPLLSTISAGAQTLNNTFKKRIFKSKMRIVRNGLIIANVSIILGVSGFIIISRPEESVSRPGAYLSETKPMAIDPLDTLSSADIAVSIAQLVQLDETTAVTNNADSVNTQLDIVPSDSQVVAKPYIVNTEIKSVSDVQSYVVVEGDTVALLAEKFGLSENSIKWSNDLGGSVLAAGTELTISPVEGFVYTVKESDTTEKIAEKYNSTAEKIVAFNDTEITGLIIGSKIVIPDGNIPAPVVFRPSGPASGFRFGSSAVYGYNGYDYGYCTWYASDRRAEVGRPIPANFGNASTWKSRAQLAGIPISNAPQVGAVIWTPPRDYYGHVGFVEEVFSDGSVRVSEMNVRGWGVRSEKVLTPDQAAGYSYIY